MDDTEDGVTQRALDRFHRLLQLQRDAEELGVEIKFPDPSPELVAAFERAFRFYDAARERLARIKAKGLWKAT